MKTRTPKLSTPSITYSKNTHFSNRSGHYCLLCTPISAPVICNLHSLQSAVCIEHCSCIWFANLLLQISGHTHHDGNMFSSFDIIILFGLWVMTASALIPLNSNLKLVDMTFFCKKNLHGNSITSLAVKSIFQSDNTWNTLFSRCLCKSWLLWVSLFRCIVTLFGYDVMGSTSKEELDPKT